MNVKQAATMGRCSDSTIYLLLKAGHLTGGKVGRLVNITTPRDQLRNIVLEHSPRSGFHHKAEKKAAVPAQ